MLARSNTTVIKFYLHISKAEQKAPIESRLKDPNKHWKFSSGDLKERAYWDEYMAAFEDALNHCSTGHAPWYVVPANKKWYRNLVVARTIADTLEAMAPSSRPREGAGQDRRAGLSDRGSAVSHAGRAWFWPGRWRNNMPLAGEGLRFFRTGDPERIRSGQYEKEGASAILRNQAGRYSCSSETTSRRYGIPTTGACRVVCWSRARPPRRRYGGNCWRS